MAEANNAHVLFVDDEQANLVVFEAVCGEDFSVLTASSAAAGLELMQKHPVGVVLSDQRMPGMSGIELLERVQSDYPDTIRLLITAYSDLQAAEDAINRGHVRRYLRKPWEPEALKAELRDAVDLYKLNSQVKDLNRRLIERQPMQTAEGLLDELGGPVEDTKTGLLATERAAEQLQKLLQQQTPDFARASGVLMQLQEAMGDAKSGLSRISEFFDEIRGTDQPPPIGTCDLNNAIRSTLEALDRSGLRDRALIRVESTGTVKVGVPIDRVEGLALVLLANAIQTAGRLPKGQGSVRIRTSTTAQHAVLEVIDNVPGPDHDQLARLAEARGTGMRVRSVSAGLRAVKRLVGDMQGNLAVTALSEGGTHVRVELPLADQ